MTVPTFAQRQVAWSSPPVDDIGYLPSIDLLAMSDDTFKQTIQAMFDARFLGWRNWRSRWADLFFPVDETGKRILDYGCGVGLESALLAVAGNQVVAADISWANLEVAKRVAKVYGRELFGRVQIEEGPPFLTTPHKFDVIQANGVLHHIPNAVGVVEQMHGWLVDGGELRIMVYSEKAWRIATGVPGERHIPVDSSPLFDTYWQHWDAVGGYADWYDDQRLRERFGKWFHVKRTQALTENGAYLGATLVKK